MTANVATSMNNNVYTGEDGNRSADHGNFVFASAQVNDTVDLNKVVAGTKLLGVRLVSAVLGGTGAVLSLGWRYADGSAGGSATALLNAVSTVAAARNDYAGAPIVFNKDAVIYATVGGVAASGQIDTVTDYIYQGTL